MGDRMPLQSLVDGSDDVRDQWLAFLTLEDLKTLSSVSSSACFARLRTLVVGRAVWRLPYPPQWRCVNGVTPTAQDEHFDSDLYENTTYLGAMDRLMKHSIRKVSVPRDAVLGYVAERLPNARSIRTWQFNGKVVGINQLSVVRRRRVYEQQRKFDFYRVPASAAWKELSLDLVQVAGTSRLAALRELESLQLAQTDVAQGASEFEVLAPLSQLKLLGVKRAKFVHFDGLQVFTQLTSLHIAGVTVDSLDGIEGLPALQTLDIHNVWSENAVIRLNGLSRLRHLRAELLGASNPLDIQLDATDLEWCSLRYCWILNYDFLAQSTQLKELDLRDTVRGVEQTIPRLPSLIRLHISSSPAATRAFDWCGSPHLSEIHLTSWNPTSADNEQADGSFLATLPGLKLLEIDNLSQFVKVPSQSPPVTSLSIRNVADEFAIRGLIRTNEHLQVLHLHATSATTLTLPLPPQPEGLLELHLVNITVDNVDVFQYFTRLRSLSVSGMSYKRSFRSLTFLRDLTSLKSLAVTRNPDFDDVSVLTSLVKLEHLSLQHTKVKDVSLLAEMTALQELELSRTLVANVDGLDCLQHLRRITLPNDVDCSVFRDSSAFPMLRSILHDDELDCCAMGHEPIAPW